MVKDHSDSERGNPLPPHGLLFPISSKGSFICTIPVVRAPEVSKTISCCPSETLVVFPATQKHYPVQWPLQIDIGCRYFTIFINLIICSICRTCLLVHTHLLQPVCLSVIIFVPLVHPWGHVTVSGHSEIRKY